MRSAFCMDALQHERSLLAQGFVRIAGVDEAGRGPLAGPVVAGCVILPLGLEGEIPPYKDSKKLTPARREHLYAALLESGAFIGVGMAAVEEIAQINILQASLAAMQRAVDNCAGSAGQHPDFLLVDGMFKVPTILPQRTLIRGETQSVSIAAASIVAKVTRDRLMAEYHLQHPQYNFLQHKGYPTKAHRAALAAYGPSPLHRTTFRGVREFC